MIYFCFMNEIILSGFYENWGDEMGFQESLVKTRLHLGLSQLVNFVFCDDAFLLEVNQKYLNHDYYTDIITFDYSADGLDEADLFISHERIRKRCKLWCFVYDKNLFRVCAHGMLHLSGLNDKTEEEQEKMRAKEAELIGLFHVEHENDRQTLRCYSSWWRPCRQRLQLLPQTWSFCFVVNADLQNIGQMSCNPAMGGIAKRADCS